jgi:flagellar hook-associated protein 1 FlgK
MANMLTTGISGLNAAQVALNTVGNNIANAGTDGYNRQIVIQTEQVSQNAGQFTIGGGVNVVAVQRQYSQYLTDAVTSTNSSMSRASTFNDLATSLNGALAGSGDLQTAMDTFYSAFSTVANAPSDPSARQALLGNASAMTAMFNTLSSQFSAQNTQINSQITGTVANINALTSNIATLNKQIASVGSGTAPNDLLDQRDEAIKNLSTYVGVNAVPEANGTISVYSSSGQTMVSGNNSYALSTGTDQYDPSQTTVLDSSGNDVTSKISGGSLGALLDYRSSVLDPAQNQLGLAATALANSINTQQAKGLDLNGKQGGPILSVSAPGVLPSSNNKGSATVTASVSDISQLTASDYILKYDGTNWNLSTTSGQNVPLTTNPDGTLSADGMTLSPSGTAQAGDSYEIEPTRNAASSLSVSMTDPSGIAAAAALTADAGSANTGTGKIGSVSVTDPTNPAVLNGATITFTSATAYSVTDAAGNTTTGTYTAGQPITADGWSLTLSGAPGSGDTFSVAANGGVGSSSGDAVTANAVANNSNTGTGTVGSISVKDPTNPSLTSGATIKFTSPTAYSITDGAGHTTTGTYTAGQPITADGWSLTLNGAPATGDSFAVSAQTNGLNDNSNALALAGMADVGVLDGGKTTTIDSYATLTTQIGSVGSQATSNLATQTSLNNQAVGAQQSVSGVSLDEEAASLVKYQQSYQASAQIISAAQTIFTSLLTAIQAT